MAWWMQGKPGDSSKKPCILGSGENARKKSPQISFFDDSKFFFTAAQFDPNNRWIKLPKLIPLGHGGREMSILLHGLKCSLRRLYGLIVKEYLPCRVGRKGFSFTVHML
jgi:hypothetical protein